MPIREQIDHHATTTPDKNAIVIGGRARTYRELAERSKSFSAYARSLPADRNALSLLDGVGKVVALDLENHLLFPELFIGATENPIACAVLDPKMVPAQIEDVLARLRPDLTVTAAMGSTVAGIATGMGLRVSSAEEIANRPLEALAANVDEPPETDDGTFLINFTSGTTSQPKAYSRSRATWRASLKRGRELFGLADAPATMCPGALAHGLALYAMVETLYSGGTFHAVTHWDVDVVAAALADGDVQRLVAVPTMITALSEKTFRETPAFPSVRQVLTAGAKLDRKHVELMTRLFPAARIMEYYGASELGFVSVSTVHPTDPDTPIHTVGKAFPGVEISIRSSENMPLGPDTPGIIYVKSDLICDGYLWGDDGKAFRVEAAGATVGDIGELTPGGALKVLGREGGMVVTGGFNVYPSEVEGVLKDIAGVDEAVVLGVDDPYLGKRLVAVVQGDFEHPDTILEQAGKALPRHKIPRELYRAASWPTTTSGKIARGRVEEFLQDGRYERVQVST